MVRGGHSQEHTIHLLEDRRIGVKLNPFLLMRTHVRRSVCFFLGQNHDSIASFAAAYSLGKQESAAAVNLLGKIPGEIKDALTLLVRPRGFEYF